DEGDVMVARKRAGLFTWDAPTIASQDAPVGFHESGASLAVDDGGRLHAIWHDHRQTEGAPRLSLQGPLTDVLESQSADAGATFSPGERVTTESSIFGRNLRVLFVELGFLTSQTADFGHVFRVWDDQRLSTRLTTSVDAYTQFLDREGPGVKFVTSPAE